MNKDLQSTEKVTQFEPVTIEGNTADQEMHVTDTNSKDHEWYVIGSFESAIDLKSDDHRLSWADLKLQCIADHDCEIEASAMVSIDPKRIREIDP